MLGGMPALTYWERVGVVPARARSKILVARSRAAGERAEAGESDGEVCEGSFGVDVDVDVDDGVEGEADGCEGCAVGAVVVGVGSKEETAALLVVGWPMMIKVSCVTPPTAL